MSCSVNKMMSASIPCWITLAAGCFLKAVVDLDKQGKHGKTMSPGLVTLTSIGSIAANMFFLVGLSYISVKFCREVSKGENACTTKDKKYSWIIAGFGLAYLTCTILSGYFIQVAYQIDHKANITSS